MHAGGQRFDPAQLHQYLDRSMNAWLRSVCRNKRFGLMTRVVKRKFFFLITGSDLLFNKLDEIEHEYFFSLSPRESVQCDSDFKRYPVLSLKWLYMTSSDCL
ncbi:hypothetical protein MBHK15_70004 [Marinobacter salarius]|nr:hypothetical protein MBHK15_70004 [Marinobacter salarius]